MEEDAAMSGRDELGCGREYAETSAKDQIRSTTSLIMSAGYLPPPQLPTTDQGRRICQVIKVRPDRLDDYKRVSSSQRCDPVTVIHPDA